MTVSQVFEAFTTSDLTRYTEGLGLSLAIAQQIVQAHDGTIAVHSANGDGATFTVRLPALEPAPAPVTQAPAT